MKKPKAVRVLAIIIAVITGTFCGCSDKSVSDKIPAPDSNAYSLECFSFSSDENLTLVEPENPDKYDENDIREYKFSLNSSSVEIEVYESVAYYLPEKFMEKEFKQYTNEEDYSGSSWGFIANSNFTEAEICYDAVSEEQYSGKISYLFTQGQILVVSAVFDREDKSEAATAVKEIVESAQYISDFYFPTEPQVLENEFYSLYCEPKWYFSSFDKEDYNASYIQYCQAETREKSGTVLEITCFRECIHENAVVFADVIYETKKEASYIEDAQRGQGEFKGIPAETVISRTDDKQSNYYFFEYNGIMYNISYSILIGDKEAEADIQELIDNLTIK